MRCETFLDRYDCQPPGAPLSRALRRHMADCPRCRLAVARVEATILSGRRACAKHSEAARRNAAALGFGEAAAGRIRAAPPDLDERIMAAVRLSPHPRREVATGTWAASGAALVLSAAVLPFVLLGWGIATDAILLGLGLVIGLVIAVIGPLYIATHTDAVRDWVEDGPAAALLPRD